MVSIAILGIALAALVVVAWVRGGPVLAWSGVREGADLLLSIAPQLLIGFALAGFVTVLVPAGAIARWVGEGSGLGGILIATAAGSVTPGGPFLQFPLVATLAQAGAAPGPIVAYLTAWSLLSVQRLLVWEIPILGVPLALSRWVVALALPVAAGLLVPVALRLVANRT